MLLFCSGIYFYEAYAHRNMIKEKITENSNLQRFYQFCKSSWGGPTWA